MASTFKLPPPAESRIILSRTDEPARRLLSAILGEWFPTRGDKPFDLDDFRTYVDKFTEHKGLNNELTVRVDKALGGTLATLAKTPGERVVRINGANSGKYRLVAQSENLAQLKAAMQVKSVVRAGGKTAVEKPAATRPLSQLCGAGECLKVLTAKDDTVLVQSENGEVYRAVLELVEL